MLHTHVAVEAGPARGAEHLLEVQVLALIDEAVAAARSSPPPAEADLTTDVYVTY